MNKEIRVLGRLISKENLEKYTGDEFKKPIFVNNEYDNVVVVEPISDLSEYFEGKQFGYCTAWRLNNKYRNMRVEEIENDLKDKYISFHPRRYSQDVYGKDNKFQAYDPKIIEDVKAVDNKKFIPVPYFDLDEMEMNIDEFEKNIIEGKYLKIVPEMPYEDPSMFIVKKQKNNSQESDIFVYLNVESMKYETYTTIVKFYNNKIIKKEWPENVYENIILDPWRGSNIVFVGAEIVCELNNELKTTTINDDMEINPIEENAKNQMTVFEKERNLLQLLDNNSKKMGLLYAKNDLINFHIAVKSSGLVILSGMSGTGKSKLITIYAKTLGLNDRFRMIPVSPAWTDDSDLLGYLDYKNMIYRPADTDLVNFLLKAQDDPEKLYMVCFDEMNLARVEHYFSQFISVLENNDDERFIQLYNSNLENRVYNSNVYPSKILVRKNVIFVGTVNIDESTFHFSDKVLDRANVIKLNMCSFNELAEVKKNIILEDIDEIDFNTNDFFETNNTFFTMTNDELSFLDELNYCLKANNPRMGIGYRVISQINQYLSAIPQDIGYSRQEAFDNLIVQRILTKLRGADDQIIKLIGNLSEENKLDNSLLYDLFEKYLNVSDFKHCKNVLCQKAKELKLYGYTI